MRLALFSGLSVAGAIVLSLTFPAHAQSSGQQTDNCVSDWIEGDGTGYQTIVLKNNCDVDVQWTMCLDRSDWDWDAFDRGSIAPKKTRRFYVNNIPPGGKYKYRYRWCTFDACPVDIPDC